MAEYHIDIGQLTQGIAEEVQKLQRALTFIEMHHYIMDYVAEKYPDMLVGELSHITGKLLLQITALTDILRERQQQADRINRQKETLRSQEEEIDRIPGLEGWSAPTGYNNFLTAGNFKGCRPIIKKGAQINVKAFEVIPFQFTPSSLIID